MTGITSPLDRLTSTGVSIWLDDLSRDRIVSGGLKKLIDERHVVGVTTNPTIFATALAKGESYDAQVAELAAAGTSDSAAAASVIAPPWLPPVTATRVASTNGSAATASSSSTASVRSRR